MVAVVSSFELAPTPIDNSKIGCSEWGSILGFGLHRNAHDVWAEKVLGRVEPEEQPDHYYFGHALERPNICLALQRLGIDAHSGRFGVALPDLPRDWMRANVDWMNSEVVVDSKTARFVRAEADPSPFEWGEADTDRVPYDVLLQVNGYCWLAGAREWVVPLVVSGMEQRIYRGAADYDLAQRAFAGVEAWREKYVLTSECPPADGSDACTDALRRKYPRDNGKMRPATPGEIEVAELLFPAKERTKTAEREEAALVQTLKIMLREQQGIEWPGGKITWKNTKTGARTFLARQRDEE